MRARALLVLAALGAVGAGVQAVVHRVQGVEVTNAIDLQPRQCLRIPEPDSETVGDVHVVACQEQHDAQVYAVVDGARDDDAGNFDRCVNAWEPSGPVVTPPPDARFSTITERWPGPTQQTVRVICLVERSSGLSGSLFGGEI